MTSEMRFPISTYEMWPERAILYGAWSGNNQPYQERVYVPYEHLLKLESKVSDTKKSNYKLRRRIHNQKYELSRLYAEVAKLRERISGGCVMEHDDISACWHEGDIHAVCQELPDKVVVTLPDPRGREVYTAHAYEYVRRVDAYIEFRREGGEGLAEELNAELERFGDGHLDLPVERLERYALMARQQEKLISGLRAICSYAYYGFVVEHGDADERAEFADRIGELGVEVRAE